MYAKWFSLPLSIRSQIATKFGVAKTGPTHVQDNRVVSDGYKFEEVERALNVKAMKEFVGIDSTDDMATLMDLVVAKIEGREIPTPEMPAVAIAMTVEPTPLPPPDPDFVLPPEAAILGEVKKIRKPKTIKIKKKK